MSNSIADNNALHFKLINTDNQWARHPTPFLMTPPALVNSIIGYRFDWWSHFKSSRQPRFLASILSTCPITCEWMAQDILKGWTFWQQWWCCLFNVLTFHRVFFGSPFAWSTHYHWFKLLNDWTMLYTQLIAEANKYGANDEYYINHKKSTTWNYWIFTGNSSSSGTTKSTNP